MEARQCSFGSRVYSRLFKTSLSALCFVLILSGCAAIKPGGEAQNARFEFGLMGDQQYNPESQAKFPHLMSELNQADLAFVVNIGDFTGGVGPCSDETFSSRKKDFEASKHPFIYTPGDNEWTDCHSAKEAKYDPLERLAKLRAVFFQGDQSLGQRTLTLTRQSDDPKYAKFRENVRWSYGDVLFVTLHMVGSNNNRGRTAEADAEYQERNAANLVWLRQAFDIAKRDGSKAIVLITHANPRFENRIPSFRLNKVLQITSASKKPSGFDDFLTVLERETVAFGKPVVLMHGDSHYFRIDKPMFETVGMYGQNFGRGIEHFTRVETFGFPEAHWVRVIVDPQDPSVFTFKQEIVEKNTFKHSFSR